MVKNLPANARDLGDVGLMPGSGRSPGGGHGNPLQYSSLEHPHGQRSVVGHSPGGHNESDMTEELSMHTLCKGDSLESVSYILSKKIIIPEILLTR